MRELLKKVQDMKESVASALVIIEDLPFYHSNLSGNLKKIRDILFAVRDKKISLKEAEKQIKTLSRIPRR